MALRSEDVRDIINYQPHWVVRWGMSTFFLVLILLLITSWMIHYPDMVQVPFRLTSHHAPKPVLANVDGKLVRLLVQDRDQVKEGQMLAFMESTADHEQVLKLATYLNSIERELTSNQPVPSSQKSLPVVSYLGELQTYYQPFQQAYTQYQATLSGKYFSQKMQLLAKELLDMQAQEKTLQSQLSIQTHDFQLAEEEYAVQKSLAEQKVIASLELKREKSKLLAKELPLKQTQTALFQIRMAQSTKRNELLETNKLVSEQEGTFRQALNTLRSALEAWRKKYIVEAPVNGKVYFYSFLEERQSITTNEVLMYISPQSNRYYGEVLVPQKNLGKIKEGQGVIIKLDSYPFQEYGTIKGTVTHLSDIPSKEGVYLAKVLLPNGLVTSSDKSITYKSGMQAKAEIITADVSLLERLLFSVRGYVSGTH